ncbi:MAG: carbohydrate kinase family protein [Oceanococcus sp.]
MTALICGSFAYDNIMVFKGRFADEILPDKVHILNVAFLVPELRKEFGGCAGNIAYTLDMLGGSALPMGTVGGDFHPYRQRLEELGLDKRYVKTIPNSFTAQAYIMTDMDDNQITAFHPGAMGEAHQQVVPRDQGVTLGMVSPDGRDGMIQHAEQFAEAGIPFIFDPGQGLPMFGADELNVFIEQATYVAVNDYESGMLSERTGLSLQEIAQRVKALIVTRGSKGSHLYVDGKIIDIPVVQAAQLADPTGCGDAYRGGLLYGLQQGMDWETTARIAALCGSIKIEQAGTQNHKFTRAEFAERFKQVFGYAY